MANSSNSFKVQVSVKTERKPGQSYRLLRGLLLLVVIITLVGNCIFILDAGTSLFARQSFAFDEERGRFRPLLPGIDKDEDRLIHVEVLSSKENASITMNGQTVNDVTLRFAGVAVTVLNQATGAVMAANMFGTYQSKAESERLAQFIEDVTPGRIICFAVLDEASGSLTKKPRLLIKSLGSMYFNRLQWRDTWAFVVQKRKYGGRVLAEGYQKSPNPYVWGGPVKVSTTFLQAARDSTFDDCQWKISKQGRRRREFCEKYDVYPVVCKCSDPISIDFDNPPFLDGTRFDIPILIMAGNRPRYLLRMLLSLKKVIGLNASMVTIYIDGFFQDVFSVGKLFNLKVKQHEHLGNKTSRISQHYKKSLSTSFDENPKAQYVVILEEDLDISADILAYFKQLLPVLDKDESLFCISAWNDQGYKHSVNDLSLTYRVEYMPGLGWVLPRKIYKNELEPDWPTPDKMYDWDQWIRYLKMNRRECIIPDVSRTFHFGARGVNMNPHFQEVYFDNHAFNKEQHEVKINADLMYKDAYEKEIDRLISSATLLNHTITPCSHPKTFIPDTQSKTYVYYIEIQEYDAEIQDEHKYWLNTARCFRIWDLDIRGNHHNMFRFWVRGNHVVIIGCPASPYCKHKPSHLIPVQVRS